MAIQLPEDPGSLDPQTTLTAEGREITSFMYDTLVYDENGKVVSGIASSWKQLSPTTYKFKIGSGATCDNGHVLTASDLAANFRRVLNPATKSPYAQAFLGTTKMTYSSDDSAKTFTITLPSPNSDFLYGLSVFPDMICPAGLANPSRLATQSFGTGPYKLTSAVANGRYTMTPRKNYSWGPGGHTYWTTSAPSQLTVDIVPNETTAANLFLTNQLSIVQATGGSVGRLQGKHGLATAKAPEEVAMLYFNQKAGTPTADPVVRQALVQAIDRSVIAKLVDNGLGQEAPSMLLPTAHCYTPAVAASIAAPNLSAAKSVLAGKHIHLTVIASSGDAQGTDLVAQYLQSQWQKAGVSVSVEEPDLQTEVQETESNSTTWDIAIEDQLGINIPSLLVPLQSGAIPPNGEDFSEINNLTYTADAKAAEKSTGAAACADWTAAENALHKVSNLLPLYYTNLYYFGHNAQFRLGGFTGTWIIPQSLAG
jgi:peptide/nickel transport system substrate-binding protein